jgi:hypothetical protein
MKRGLVISIVSLLLPVWTGMPTAAEVVSPKKFLKLEVASDLGELFPDAATQVLKDHGYAFEDQVATTLGQDMGEIVSNKLQAGDYGLLLWGGHGSSIGETMLESCTSYEDAEDRLDYLVEFLYFNRGDLIIFPPGEGGAQYYGLSMVYDWVDTEPSSCDVAFVNTSYGGVQGDFNATHRLADPDSSNDVVLRAGFSCIVSWATSATYGTLKLAHGHCVATQTDYPYELYGSGEIQLFSFDDPAAGVLGFSVANGRAKWAVESEFRTASYVIEGSRSAKGPWHAVGKVNAAKRSEYSVAVSGAYDYYRLVEVERGGGRSVHGVASPEESAAQAQAREPTARPPAIKRSTRRRTPGPARTSNPANPSEFHIYTNAAMQQAVQTAIADLWTSHGYTTNVEVVPDVSAVGADYLRAYIKGDIALKAQGGATCFLLVGDAVDWDEFHGTSWPAPWDSIQTDYLSSGQYSEPASNNVIPTFVVWDTLPRGEGNMSWWAPYWFTDIPYADLDDNGSPDVVVTRLPFVDPADVYGYATKLTGGMWQANTVVSLVEDTEWIMGSGDGYNALAAANYVEDHLPVGSAVSHIYGSSEPLISARNTATADLLNANEPDLVIMMGARSNKYFPARFMDKYNAVNPWQMSMLSTEKPMCVIAASCGTAGFARSEYDSLSHPVAHDFLAEPNKGAVAWIGPTAGTWQSANQIVASYIIDELFAVLGRPGGEAFRIAIERVLTEFADDQPVLDAAASYVYLGDPLVAFQDIATAVKSPPSASKLDQCIPNPFNPRTTISYSIAQPGPVTLRIYDVQGRRVRTLVAGYLRPDRYTVSWNGRDDAGTQVSSGVYFYRLETGSFGAARKMVLVR